MFLNKLKIKNFGPIGEGYYDNDGFIPMNQLSIFCGTQGTGKSTIVKIYSTLVWLEKALMRGDFKANYVEQYNRFIKRFVAYQGIDGYIKDNTEIHYVGQNYEFIYESGHFTVVEHRDEMDYERPQIMYYPAERNLLSVLDKAAGIKGMPDPLLTMLEDYRLACKSMTDDILLPINNVSFHYDALNQVASIVAPNYKVRMSEASSGFQSLSPLYITLRYLYMSVGEDWRPDLLSETNEEQERIDKRINLLLMDDTIDENTRSRLIKKLSDNRNKRLISIIEEPEQNLFPDSQEKILYELIRLSAQENHQLLLTTHSPYFINYLSLAIKAYDVSKLELKKEDRQRLCDIVPEQSHIDGAKVSVFQLDLDGHITELQKYDNMPSDENKLNQFMMDANTKFSHMIDIQSSYE